MKYDTDKYKPCKIECLFNKYTIGKSKGLAVDYLVCWTKYDPKWDKWYNVKDLDNTTKLDQTNEEGLAQQG